MNTANESVINGSDTSPFTDAAPDTPLFRRAPLLIMPMLPLLLPPFAAFSFRRRLSPLRLHFSLLRAISFTLLPLHAGMIISPAATDDFIDITLPRYVFMPRYAAADMRSQQWHNKAMGKAARATNGYWMATAAVSHGLLR